MKELYRKIEQHLGNLNFEGIWPTFRPYPFALYDQETVQLKDRQISWDSRFRGNTAIKFEGRMLAIWNVDEATLRLNTKRLASLIVHEMFHAFQLEYGEKRFRNEIDAIHYAYEEDNLSAKYEENRLLADLLDDFKQLDWLRLAALRAYRRKHFPQAIAYESYVETCEGMATYAEWSALKMLDRDLYNQRIEEIQASLKDPASLFPIRTINNNSGAALLVVAESQGEALWHVVGEEESMLDTLLLPKANGDSPQKNDDIKRLLQEFKENNRKTVQEALATAETKKQGPFHIVGFDPLNTVKADNYIFFRHFVLLKKGDETMVIDSPSVAETTSDGTLKTIRH